MSNTYTCRTCGDDIEGIVELVEHGCEDILRGRDLDRQEQSTLLFIESRVVEYGGELDPQKMNHEDTQNIKLFQAADVLQEVDFQVTEFTDKAWQLASECRRMRAHRYLRTHGDEENVDFGTDPADEV